MTVDLESEYTIDLQLSESIDNATHEGLRVLDQTLFFGERGRDPDLESVWYRSFQVGRQEFAVNKDCRSDYKTN